MSCPGSEEAELGDNRRSESRLRSRERLDTRSKAYARQVARVLPAVPYPRARSHGTKDYSIVEIIVTSKSKKRSSFFSSRSKFASIPTLDSLNRMTMGNVVKITLCLKIGKKETEIYRFREELDERCRLNSVR